LRISAYGKRAPKKGFLRKKKDRMLVPKKVHTLEPHNNTHFGVHSDISAIKEGVIMYNEVAV